MSIEISLFKGKHIQLGPINHEQDPEIESRWTHDSEFMRLMYFEPMRPLSDWQVRKKYEALEKSIQEDKNLFHFRIRSCEDDRMIGLIELLRISWTNSTGLIRLGIAAVEDRRHGYGSEVLQMIMRYAFKELNLHRLSAWIQEYNTGALALFRKFGFVEEVRRRQAIVRDGQRWDLLHLGLLGEAFDFKPK